MANSMIKRNKNLVLLTGTMPEQTGDIEIENFFPSPDFIPIVGYYRTTYNQFRPITVAYYPGTTTKLLVLGVTDNMKGRDIRVYAQPI